MYYLPLESTAEDFSVAFPLFCPIGGTVNVLHEVLGFLDKEEDAEEAVLCRPASFDASYMWCWSATERFYAELQEQNLRKRS